MAGMLPSDPSYHGTQDFGHNCIIEKTVESDRWYFSRKEIEENSPSKVDGIDLKKETYLRKSYCTFLQDFGMRLKVPQVAIATAILFCHRFFLHHSHAKNDRRTIATVCMFLAGKVEETPRPLKDVILVSYEIIHKKDPIAGQRIKQKEVYEQQKELILVGERIVLATLVFDLNVIHPYKPLVEAIKKFNVAKGTLAQVAWNFVNDGLRTSLCLQFRSHHIAAGAIFLAAKFLKVRLPSDGDRVWWTEFDITPRQLEEVSNQMLELYEQNRPPLASQGSEVEGSMDPNPNPNPKPLPPHTPLPFQDNNNNNNKNLSSLANNATAPEPTHTQNPCYEPLQEALINEHKKGSMEVCGMKTFDKDKVKATMKQRKLLRSENLTRKKDATMDENDLIEKELEDGVELAAAEMSEKGDRHLGGLEKMEEGEVSDGSGSPRKDVIVSHGNRENERNKFARYGSGERKRKYLEES